MMQSIQNVCMFHVRKYQLDTCAKIQIVCRIPVTDGYNYIHHLYLIIISNFQNNFKI